ncbi:hypothetical protein PoB_002656700 [Plakobranchus ocellatus]|uniref:Uncharacterized protein n=1 Tax=Plakobranchus ocellatus TaxID=259542 RepID=A0AAV3ZZF6_9GAST|nr:hypothetical protein PoB_002656700 [Plakobranchus ocellatus]
MIAGQGLPKGRFQALLKARTPVAGLEPVTGNFKRISGRVRYPLSPNVPVTEDTKRVGRGSGGSSGRSVGYQVGGPRFESLSGTSQFLIAPLCPPSTKWVARSLKIW